MNIYIYIYIYIKLAHRALVCVKHAPTMKQTPVACEFTECTAIP